MFENLLRKFGGSKEQLPPEPIKTECQSQPPNPPSDSTLPPTSIDRKIWELLESFDGAYMTESVSTEMGERLVKLIREHYSTGGRVMVLESEWKEAAEAKAKLPEVERRWKEEDLAHKATNLELQRRLNTKHEELTQARMKEQELRGACERLNGEIAHMEANGKGIDADKELDIRMADANTRVASVERDYQARIQMVRRDHAQHIQDKDNEIERLKKASDPDYKNNLRRRVAFLIRARDAMRLDLSKARSKIDGLYEEIKGLSNRVQAETTDREAVSKALKDANNLIRRQAKEVEDRDAIIARLTQNAVPPVVRYSNADLAVAVSLLREVSKEAGNLLGLRMSAKAVVMTIREFLRENEENATPARPLTPQEIDGFVKATLADLYSVRGEVCDETGQSRIEIGGAR